MNKNIKKMLIAALLAAIIAFSSGCSKQRDYGENFNLETDCQYSYADSFTDWKKVQSDGNGQYILKNKFIYYYNTEKKTLAPLCNKANCLHDMETDKDKLIDCNAYIISSVDQYVPKNLYQTAEEATYHMYLSNIQGEFDENSEQFIIDEKKYIASLEQKLEGAINSGDNATAMIIDFELNGRRKGFERLNAQYEKLLENPNADRYWVDEINLEDIWNKYDRDMLLFMVSAVILILLLSEG